MLNKQNKTENKLRPIQKPTSLTRRRIVATAPRGKKAPAEFMKRLKLLSQCNRHYQNHGVGSFNIHDQYALQIYLKAIKKKV